jgi:hypothetical protein
VEVKLYGLALLELYGLGVLGLLELSGLALLHSVENYSQIRSKHLKHQ